MSPRSGSPYLRSTLLASTAFVLAVGPANRAEAQVLAAAVPPIYQNIDANGVDTVLDSFNVATTDVSIGQSSRDGLSYTRYWSGAGWRDTLAVTLTGDQNSAVVSIGGASESFTKQSGGAYTSDQGSGSTLAYNGSSFSYISGNGITVSFAPANGSYDRYVSNLGWANSISYPDGTKWTFTYKGINYCPYNQGDYEGTCPTARSVRLQSVTNNLGYQLKLSYAANVIRTPDAVGNFQTLIKVTAINNVVEACAPGADSCALSRNWPSASYSTTSSGSGSYDTVTDALGRAKRYTYDNTGRMTGVRRPGSSSDDVVVGYGDYGVSSVVINGATTRYSVSEAGASQTVTITDAANNAGVTTSTIATGLVSSVSNALNQTTLYSYDSDGRLTQATAPEGNSVQYTYDGRGNVVTTTASPKPGSSLTNIVTSAVYPTDCTSGPSCNKPISTIDAGGNKTDYVYDPTHGGVVSSMSPPNASGTRPQMRYGYTNYNGIYRLTGTSTCRTSANCVGSVDENTSTIAYAGSNILATSVSAGAGDGSITATSTFSYDNYGNRISIDGRYRGQRIRRASTTISIANSCRSLAPTRMGQVS